MSRCTNLRAAAPCCPCRCQLPLQLPGCTTLRASVRFACPEARRPTLGRADLLRHPQAPGSLRRVSVTWRRRCLPRERHLATKLQSQSPHSVYYNCIITRALTTTDMATVVRKLVMIVLAEWPFPPLLALTPSLLHSPSNVMRHCVRCLRHCAATVTMSGRVLLASIVVNPPCCSSPAPAASTIDGEHAGVQQCCYGGRAMLGGQWLENTNSAAYAHVRFLDSCVTKQGGGAKFPRDYQDWRTIPVEGGEEGMCQCFHQCINGDSISCRSSPKRSNCGGFRLRDVLNDRVFWWQICNKTQNNSPIYMKISA